MQLLQYTEISTFPKGTCLTCSGMLVFQEQKPLRELPIQALPFQNLPGGRKKVQKSDIEILTLHNSTFEPITFDDNRTIHTVVTWNTF